MDPCEFFLFSKLTETSKAEGFDDVQTVEHNVTEQLLMVPKTEFGCCFLHWQE
jgi:hypothetical protein